MTSEEILLFKIDQLVEKAEIIKREIHTLNLSRYLAQWMPVRYPNKGLLEIIAEDRIIEIHHEAFGQESLQQIDISKIETFIDQYGNSHQRDYRYLVIGHRFDETQIVQFRGVLGSNRVYKLILSLLILGCPPDRLKLVDHKPSYRLLIDDDLKDMPREVDVVVIGGLVVGGRAVRTTFAGITSVRGDIVSWRLIIINGKRVLFTTFPYGDLCYWVTTKILTKKPKYLIFTGAVGAIAKGYRIGEVFVPKNFYWNGTVSEGTHKVHTAFNNIAQPKESSLHGCVRTPLEETEPRINELRGAGITSIDVEAVHFHRACIEYQQQETCTGVLLYVSDVTGGEKVLSEIDFSELRTARKRCIEIISQLWI